MKDHMKHFMEWAFRRIQIHLIPILYINQSRLGTYHNDQRRLNIYSHNSHKILIINFHKIHLGNYHNKLHRLDNNLIYTQYIVVVSP
jgi:hypothetical protein